MSKEKTFHLLHSKAMNSFLGGLEKGGWQEEKEEGQRWGIHSF
jgi:hypothetical protein